MSTVEGVAGGSTPFSGRTAWARNLETPLREFLRTETGGAAVLLAATAAALAWVNIDASSYDSFWSTRLSIGLGSAEVSLDLREWVNSGLMTFFFFVVGLEARREFDLGELRERRRFALPVLAAVSGMGGAIALFLAFNAGRPSAHGWGTVMSTDTAFALGLLALVGPRFSDRLRAFMLTVVVVDDLVALVIIATVYTATFHVVPLLAAVGFYAAVLVARRFPTRPGAICFALGACAWVSLLKSGVEPVVIGVAMGLLAYAFPAPRSNLERATERYREFREQPTAELARLAAVELRIGDVGQRAAAAEVSPLDELRHRPALRARERWHRDRRRLLGSGAHVANHARDLLRLRGRQAARHPRRVLARHPVEPRGKCGRLSAGRRSPAAARSPGSASRSRSSSPHSPSTEASSRKRSSES